MREIKFRAKRIGLGAVNSKWAYGFYVERDGYEKGMIYDRAGLGVDVDPKTLGQFTGLTDDYDREIYDGDILVWENEEESNFEYYTVQWFKCGWAFHWAERDNTPEFLEDTEEFEVAGNIYDSPELLEKEKP